MNDVEPLLLFFFSNLESKFGMETYHSFLIGGSISIVCIDGCSKSFFGPMVFGNEIMVNKASSCSGVNEGLEVDDLSE